ncbi:palmitoyltransferase AKR1-like [Haliotis rufescens]|uniref:palmitoyltransferase AKR1-like n=1 Tax=Haliotis rufescens TaxID=6454 RepID=UPI00201EED09|nr:palmitoyltransferase AKR1-like [Haliotis rufescens]
MRHWWTSWVTTSLTSPEEVKRLLSLGVDVNCRGWRNWTPLMWAAGYGNSDVVELLVSKGADVSLVDRLGYNILHFAGGGWVTTSFTSPEEVKRHLSLGVDVNCRGWRNWTPLMWAAGYGNSDVVELLVSRGADVSLVDRLGYNILHLACMGGDLETVKFVLSLNVVDINARNKRVKTVADLARYWGRPRVVDLLVSCGAQ